MNEINQINNEPVRKSRILLVDDEDLVKPSLISINVSIIHQLAHKLFLIVIKTRGIKTRTINCAAISVPYAPIL